jgi:hypothetical protein
MLLFPQTFFLCGASLMILKAYLHILLFQYFVPPPDFWFWICGQRPWTMRYFYLYVEYGTSLIEHFEALCAEHEDDIPYHKSPFDSH